MKHLYLLVFFLFVAFSYGQDAGNQADIPGFRLYPNPATEGKVFINTSLNAPKKILIYDVLGTQVLETTILGRELSLSELNSGVYVLRVLEGDKIATRKLVIK